MEKPQPLVIEPFNGFFDEDEIPDRGNNFGRHADIADNFGDESAILGEEVEEIMSEDDSDSDIFFFGELEFEENEKDENK
jgi:hypothetical protein